MFNTFPTAGVAAPSSKVDDHRNRMAAKSRAKSKIVQEIGEPPERDWDLWNRYRFNLNLFLAENFPHSTGLSPFSRDHRTMIERIQETVLLGGQDLNEVFRGGCKSTITENTAIWAGGYRHRAFFVPIGSTDEAAQIALDSIQMEFMTNDRLMLIFPAACHAAIALEGVAQRGKTQTMGGQRTMIQWTTSIASNNQKLASGDEGVKILWKESGGDRRRACGRRLRQLRRLRVL